MRTNCIHGNTKSLSLILVTSRLESAAEAHARVPAGVGPFRYFVTKGSRILALSGTGSRSLAHDVLIIRLAASICTGCKVGTRSFGLGGEASFFFVVSL